MRGTASELGLRLRVLTNQSEYIFPDQSYTSRSGSRLLFHCLGEACDEAGQGRDNTTQGRVQVSG